jgi:phage shock protein C
MEPVLKSLNSTVEYKWVRGCDGLVAGVCEGLGKRFGVDPWLVRLLWLVSILALGTGLLAYVILAFTLPREDRIAEAHEKKILGVSGRIARVTGMEIGLVRALTVTAALFSFGATLVGYVVLYFVIPDERRSVYG